MWLHIERPAATNAKNAKNAKCAEADLAFLMAYAHIWAESESFLLFFPPLCFADITRIPQQIQPLDGPLDTG